MSDKLTHKEVERQVAEALEWNPPVANNLLPRETPATAVKKMLRQRLENKRG